MQAAERRKQKKKDKKERQSSRARTVNLVPYAPPDEPESGAEDAGVERQLDFEGCVTPNPEAQSNQKIYPLGPITPEELVAEEEDPPVHGVQDVHLIPEETTEGTDQRTEPNEVDAPERDHFTGESGQPEEESDKAQQDGEQPEGEPNENPDEEPDSSKQPPEPPDPNDPSKDPDDPDQDPDEEEDQDEDEEDPDDEEDLDQEGEGGEEEEKEEDVEVDELVETEATKKKKKEAERSGRARDAALIRLPYALPDQGPRYKGTLAEPWKQPPKSNQWASKRGPIPKSQDTSSIDHKENRAFENIRLHQISSIFTLQKHLADCTKGSVERNSTPAPLRGPTGEYSPCQTEMAVKQDDDGMWSYEYSELPGLISMKYGMKMFHIIEQALFGTPPTGPHKNLVRKSGH